MTGADAEDFRTGFEPCDVEKDARRLCAEPGAQAGETFVALSIALLTDVAAHAQHMARTRDPEATHQFRVSLRRFRALLKIYRPLLSPAFYAAANQGARELAAGAAISRRLDVAMDEMIPAVEKSLGKSERKKLLARLRRAADDDETRARAIARTAPFLLAVHRALLTTRWQGSTARAARSLERSTKRFARKRLERQYRRVLALGSRIDTLSTEERHALRKEGKALRYAIAFFANLFAAQKVEPVADAIRRLQNELGALNDAAEAALLVEFAPEPEFRDVIAKLTGIFEARLREGWPKARQRWTEFEATSPFWR